MTNILNTLKTPNTNVIPAKKLSKSKNQNLLIDNVPQRLYKYSFEDAVKQRENKRKQTEYDAFKRVQRKTKDRNYTFFAILSAVTALAVFLNKKINK